jgi:1-acyl-sn-glycerol-3-phosphate acyltransferase
MTEFEARIAVNQRTTGQPPARPARLRAVPEPPVEPDQQVDVWDRRVAGALSFLRSRLTGGYEVDEFGFDQELADSVFLPLLRLLYRDWFRAEVQGADNLPSTGSALVVANHSGVIALDALMLSVAVHDEHPAGRYLRLLGADLVFRMPVISELARKHGGTLACNADAERLLGTGELVGVFPEGFKGVGKLYRDRYKLQRFGRGGFVSAALRTGTPIIPVSIVGAEETYPMLGNIKPLARLLGIPYFPVTPTFPWLGPLGLIPLPSKWLIAFGEPIETAKYADLADDPAVVFNLADQVRETIQQTLHGLLAQREAGEAAREV